MDLPQRKKTRLDGYDYSLKGAYFITICAFKRKCLFGESFFGTVNEGTEVVGAIHESPSIRLNENGEIIAVFIKSLFTRFPKVQVDHFVVMPNHLHLLPVIQNEEQSIHNHPGMRQEESSLNQKQRSIISKVVGYLKMNSTKRIREINPDIGEI